MKKGKKMSSGRRSRGVAIAQVILVLASAALLLLLGGLLLASDELEVTFHHLYSPKVVGAENIRVIVLSDLHNKEFGAGNGELIRRIEALEPDLIVMAGDMADAGESSTRVILELCQNLAPVAPIYYGIGNHEGNLLYEKGIPLDEQLREAGVHLLINEGEEVTVGKTPFLIGSLGTSPAGFAEYGADFFRDYEQSTAFKLLIAHWPGLYEETLARASVDLGVSGHYHGGQVRLPLAGGLYHGDTGFFPRYSGGMYTLPGGTLFVSRGMGGHEAIPRINNRPELAVIDINGRRESKLS